MPIALDNKSTVLTSADLASLEARLGFRLPADYRQFLIEHNVAIPASNQVVLTSVITSVDQFLGVSPVPDQDLITQRAVYEGRFSSDLLAIDNVAGAT